MTMTQKSIPTTIVTGRGAKATASTLFDFGSLENSTRVLLPKLQLLISQAITQWSDGLSSFQKSGPLDRGLSLKISASYLRPKE